MEKAFQYVPESGVKRAFVGAVLWDIGQRWMELRLTLVNLDGL